MFDMGQVSAAASAIKAVKDLGKVFFDAQVDAAVQAKVISAMEQLGKAQDTLYDVRDELFRLQSENEQLKREAVERDEFKSRLDRYELVKTAGNAVVFKFKGEPEHFACPNCINHRRIEILQDNRTTRGKYRCTAAGCGAEFPINPQQWPKAGTADGVGPGNWMGS